MTLRLINDISFFNLGTKDSSGLTFYYTDKLRQYDAGIADVGLGINSWFIIPPKQNDWVSVGYCMHQCTEVSITLHCIALHCITLHYITLHYITLHYITLRYVTLRYVTLHTYMHAYIHTYIHTYIHNLFGNAGQ